MSDDDVDWGDEGLDDCFEIKSTPTSGPSPSPKVSAQSSFLGRTGSGFQPIEPPNPEKQALAAAPLMVPSEIDIEVDEGLRPHREDNAPRVIAASPRLLEREVEVVRPSTSAERRSYMSSIPNIERRFDRARPGMVQDVVYAVRSLLAAGQSPAVSEAWAHDFVRQVCAPSEVSFDELFFDPGQIEDGVEQALGPVYETLTELREEAAHARKREEGDLEHVCQALSRLGASMGDLTQKFGAAMKERGVEEGAALVSSFQVLQMRSRDLEWRRWMLENEGPVFPSRLGDEEDEKIELALTDILATGGPGLATDGAEIVDLARQVRTASSDLSEELEGLAVRRCGPSVGSAASSAAAALARLKQRRERQRRAVSDALGEMGVA